MFDSCRRQYYYTYYGSWGGWKDTAEPHIRLLYQLKKMTTLPQLVGSVVHDAISRILKKSQQTGRTNPLQAAQTNAITLFNQHLIDSENKRWLQSASRYTNLFEHYYNESFDANEARLRIAESLEAFFSSKPYQHLCTVPPDQWLSLEKLESFTCHATKLWVTLDVAVRHNGGISIYDWKTGREREADKRQLSVYALYATTIWGVALQNLSLFDVYLQTGTLLCMPIDADTLEDTRRFIGQSIVAMQKVLDNPVANTASINTFPMTDHHTTCTSCPFKTVCYAQAKPTPKIAKQEKPVQLSLF